MFAGPNGSGKSTLYEELRKSKSFQVVGEKTRDKISWFRKEIPKAFQKGNGEILSFTKMK
ncbi:hypothetical protein LEP1GSC061_0795 [Leptospira wolffii serovar Khorat str. Khorat-H2]|nr:hypothetical protein LEP1GSC061_0795 [Leptospira wolffii serovar Khorat str. Khorat-H2]